MSTLAWGAGVITRRRAQPPHTGVMWTAIVAAALLFGVSHLPAAAVTGALTPGIIVRVVTLNGGTGLVFGWLFWRWSLEAAMVAHAVVHLAWTAASLILAAS